MKKEKPQQKSRKALIFGVVVVAFAIVYVALSNRRKVNEDVVKDKEEKYFVARRDGRYEAASHLLMKSAVSGNFSRAMFHLGMAHTEGGWGFKQDKKQAAGWFKKAAEAGSFPGMARYAYSLKYAGLRANEAGAKSWAKKALSSKDNYARGFCYFHGVGTEVNYDKAKESFAKAATDGDEYGQYMLGTCYRYGYGTSMDKALSLYWYTLAAAQGYAEAQYWVANLYRTGIALVNSEKFNRFISRKRM